MDKQTISIERCLTGWVQVKKESEAVEKKYSCENKSKSTSSLVNSF